MANDEKWKWIVMIKKNLLIASIGLFAVGELQCLEQTDWRLTSTLGLSHDANVNNGLHDEDQVSDNIVSFSTDLAHFYDLSASSLLTYKVQFDAERFEQLGGLNWFSVAADIQYSWQDQFGFLAPFYNVSLNVKRLDSDDASRDSNIILLQTMATKRLTSKVTARLGYSYSNRTSGHRVYEQEQHKVFGNVDYLLNQTTTFYTIFSYRKGDIYSAARVSGCGELTEHRRRAQSTLVSKRAESIKSILSHHDINEGYELAPYAKAIWPDQGFNQSLCGDWYGYRLDAKTMTFDLGVSYLLTPSLTLDASYLFADSEVTDDYSYQRDIVKAVMMYQF